MNSWKGNQKSMKHVTHTLVKEEEHLRGKESSSIIPGGSQGYEHSHRLNDKLGGEMASVVLVKLKMRFSPEDGMGSAVVLRSKEKVQIAIIWASMKVHGL